MDDQQQADAVLAALVGGVPCYRCGSLCESQLGMLWTCAICRVIWVPCTMLSPECLQNLRAGETLKLSVDVTIT